MRKCGKVMNRKQLGQLGENYAAQMLQEKGLEIVARNWRCASGELDLVARDGSVIVFVEVRTRTIASSSQAYTQRYGSVLEAITPQKRVQVKRLAEIYLYQHRLTEQSVRFDVVLVEKTGEQMTATHIEHAF